MRSIIYVDTSHFFVGISVTRDPFAVSEGSVFLVGKVSLAIVPIPSILYSHLLVVFLIRVV